MVFYTDSTIYPTNFDVKESTGRPGAGILVFCPDGSPSVQIGFRCPVRRGGDADRDVSMKEFLLLLTVLSYIVRNDMPHGSAMEWSL